uniref:hypothetical protein n=1 Tax=Pseudomonas fluorescens TaxID=294 RepID=UPI0025B793EC|nr:hypothetical protein [Pseudomonas fluorescens]
MEFYQLAIASVIIFFIQVWVPIWIIGWRLELPGDDPEKRKRYFFNVMASFIICAVLAFSFICVLDLVFNRS